MPYLSCSQWVFTLFEEFYSPWIPWIQRGVSLLPLIIFLLIIFLGMFLSLEAEKIQLYFPFLQSLTISYKTSFFTCNMKFSTLAPFQIHRILVNLWNEYFCLNRTHIFFGASRMHSELHLPAVNYHLLRNTNINLENSEVIEFEFNVTYLSKLSLIYWLPVR